MPISDTNGCKVLQTCQFLSTVTTVTIVTSVSTVQMFYVLPYYSTTDDNHGTHVCSCLLILKVNDDLKRWDHGHSLQPTAKAMAKMSIKVFLKGVGQVSLSLTDIHSAPPKKTL